jgi:hypothetical protein
MLSRRFARPVGVSPKPSERAWGRLGWTAVLVTVMSVLALDSSALGGPLTASKSMTRDEQAAALAYWTRSRIAAARPMKLPVDRSFRGADAAVQPEPASADPVGIEPPGAADPGAARIARAAYAQDWMALDEALAPDEEAPDLLADVPTGTAGLYTSYDVNTQGALWKIYPHIWSGRLTFMTPGGTSSCSATVIRGNNVVTAAHCAYDTTNNRWYSTWVFTPAYRNGSAPYGTFAAQVCTILTAYVNLTGGFSIGTWSRHDVAVCTMGKNAAGQTLNGAVGWAGRLWDAAYNQLVFNSGYPARTYTDALISNGPAQYLRSCTAETFLHTTYTMGAGCTWGRGISGGAWLVQYKPFVISGFVNSVNSGLFLGQQNLYGPRFNSSNIVPLCSARGC